MLPFLLGLLGMFYQYRKGKNRKTGFLGSHALVHHDRYSHHRLF